MSPVRRGRGQAFPYLGEEEAFPFPHPDTADENGIVCAGGNLSPGLLLSAYRSGIFPWFSEGEPILWWSPDPRFVLFPPSLHASGTMLRVLRHGIRAGCRAGQGSSGRGAQGRGDQGDSAGRRRYELSLDRDFEAVIKSCSASPRPGQRGTWITAGMTEAYIELHRLGLAHSAEARLDGRLVGGLYGVSLGSLFFGESMFSHEDDASKAAFIPLVWRLRDEGFTLVDSQVYTEHLAGLGAREIPRSEYLRLLSAGLEAPTRRGNWGELFPGFPDSAEYRRTVSKEQA
ncbi:MAG TPA: leucyl/phenylalanyl-tRNA--protein transferase [Rectinemataceae bacterium]|nr:leucyl/phenylalanyl-tRNA--protein transferase [Rectinemataceae bacterium]